MFIKDIMTTKVLSVSTKASVGDAQKIMKDAGVHRLPVIDDGRLVGLVTADSLERIKPRTTAPVLWQISYVLSHTNVGDVMRKNVVTVKPGDTLEYAIAKAQKARVGMLVVVDGEKVVGVATTNDFFYKIVNPTLGIGEPGMRIVLPGCGDGKPVETIVALINKMGIEIKVIWAIVSPVSGKKDLTVHLATGDAGPVISQLKKSGFSAKVVER